MIFFSNTLQSIKSLISIKCLYIAKTVYKAWIDNLINAFFSFLLPYVKKTETEQKLYIIAPFRASIKR